MLNVFQTHEIKSFFEQQVEVLHFTHFRKRTIRGLPIDPLATGAPSIYIKGYMVYKNPRSCKKFYVRRFIPGINVQIKKAYKPIQK